MVTYPYAYMTYIVSPLAGLGGCISWRPPTYSLYDMISRAHLRHWISDDRYFSLNRRCANCSVAQPSRCVQAIHQTMWRHSWRFSCRCACCAAHSQCTTDYCSYVHRP